jgi:DNA repair exonuclease SbcCD ATPase subunit
MKRESMRDLKFRLAKANGILCFGEEGVELHFKDYGNVVLVQGINLDNPGTDDDPASNGAGKSSLQEILSIGLYGKQVKNSKKLTAIDIINVTSDKGQVEVIWDIYRVVRTYRRTSSGSITGKIEIWESPELIWDDDSKQDLGGAHNSQHWIQEKLGLSHHAFCNVVIFDDSATYSFLGADAEAKRQIVENLLQLDEYRQYHKNAKAYLKLQKALVDRIAVEYHHAQEEVESCEQHIQTSQEAEKTWKNKKKIELQELLGRLKAKQELLSQTDAGKEIANWQQAQDRMAQITIDMGVQETKRDGVSNILKEVRETIIQSIASRDEINSVVQGINQRCIQLTAELTKNEDLFETLSTLQEGAVCPKCHGVISKDNYGHVLSDTQDALRQLKEQHGKQFADMAAHHQVSGEKNKSITRMQDRIAEAEQTVKAFDRQIESMRSEIGACVKVPKPDGNVAEQILEAEIAELKKQGKTRKDEYSGESPYKEIIEATQKQKLEKEEQKDEKAEELKDAERELPYYQYWVDAFGDNGIRKFVVDGIIPALNGRISYWMQYLIDSKIELTFDNRLFPTITRNGNPVKYESLSSGESQRGNLAVSQAFAYVMMLNSGSCPSLVFLDEVTGGGIDRCGVVGIYNMIFELAKERQVFVTTHNENLLNMLQGCERITLKKENDTTILVN